MTYVGARDHRELLDKYAQITRALDFRFSRPVATRRPTVARRPHGLDMEAP
jgi:hypothetical protein